MTACNFMRINDDLHSLPIHMNHHNKMQQPCWNNLCVVLINTWGLGFCWQYLLMKQNLEMSTLNPLVHIVSLKIDAVPIMALHLLSVMTPFWIILHIIPHWNFETLLQYWEIYLSATGRDQVSAICGLRCTIRRMIQNEVMTRRRCEAIIGTASIFNETICSIISDSTCSQLIQPD